MSGIIRIIGASLIVTLAACGGSTGSTGTYATSNGNGGIGGSGAGNGGSQTPPANTVNASPSLAFSPSTLTVNAGDVVTFAFGSVAHNVAFDNPVAATPTDIGGFNSNTSIQRTFTTSGTYTYHCTIHPFMMGTVVVR